MPPRWPRKPDRINDPEFRRLEDRLNFAVHFVTFTAFNSGLWFFQILWERWSHLPVLTGIWATAVLAHALYVFWIADYSPDPTA
ncbi:MAG: Pr2TM family membrane protein [Synechococcales cyanobacterium RM1_1_8]|nr:Pr2TM family membrane protein [Synechococcales cyanobacterium RM1_1_8]